MSFAQFFYYQLFVKVSVVCAICKDGLLTDPRCSIRIRNMTSPAKQSL